MTECKYIKLNASTSTCSFRNNPITDANGDKLALVDLQLPANMAGNIGGNNPKKVQMAVSKFDIPLNKVAFGKIPIDNYIATKKPVYTYSNRYKYPPPDVATGCVTKGKMCLWPFYVNRDGSVWPGYNYDDFNVQFVNVEGEQKPKWTIRALMLPYPCSSSNPDGSDNIDFLKWKQENDERGNQYLITDIDVLLRSLTETHAALLYFNQARNGTGIEWKIINDRLTISTYPRCSNTVGSLQANSSWNTGTLYGAWIHPFRDRATEKYYFRWLQGALTPEDAETVEANGFKSHPWFYSIVVNRYIRDLLPSLPWIEIDMEKDVTLKGNQRIINWANENYDDPIAYVLDTTRIMPDYLVDTSTYLEGSSSFDTIKVKQNGLITRFTFENINPISFCNITSFAIMARGLPTTNQILPVNLTNQQSELNTTVPIIELYYPLWNRLSDLTTDLVMSRDNFTNMALIEIPPSALNERNIVFQVFQYMKDGTLLPLTIQDGQTFSIQITFAIYY